MGKREMFPVKAYSVKVTADEVTGRPIIDAREIRGPVTEIEGSWGADEPKKTAHKRFADGGHSVRKVFWSEKDGARVLIVYVHADETHPDADTRAPVPGPTKPRRSAVGRRARKMRR